MENIQVLSHNVNMLAECPVWDAEKGLLYWTDISAKKAYAYDCEADSQSILFQGKNIASFAINKSGGFICGCFEGVYLWDDKAGFSHVATEYRGMPLKVNDGAADAAGRFLFGTNYYRPEEKEIQTGAVYCIERDGTLR